MSTQNGRSRFPSSCLLAVAAGLAVFVLVACPPVVDDPLVQKVEDHIAPVLTVLSPLPNSPYMSTVSFEGTATDDALAEGDALGAITMISYEVANDQTLGGAVTITDGVAAAAPDGDGGITWNAADGTFGFEFSTVYPNLITDSQLSVTVKIADRNGMEAEKTVTLLESEGPRVVLASPNPDNGEYKDLDHITVSGTIANSSEDTSSASEVATLRWSVVGKAWFGQLDVRPNSSHWDGTRFVTTNQRIAYPEQFTYDPVTREFTTGFVVPWGAGALLPLEVTATDLNGHQTTASFTLLSASGGPEIYITDPVPNATNDPALRTYYSPATYDLPGHALTVRGSVFDYTEVTAMSYSVSGTGASGSNLPIPLVFDVDGNFSFALDDVSLAGASGRVHVTVIAANDKAESRPDFYLEEDSASPTITVTGMGPAYVKEGSVVTLSFLASDALSGLEAAGPAVTIAGHSVTATANPDGNPATPDYAATWTMAAGDPSGPSGAPVAFQATATDKVYNAVSTTTGPTVTYYYGAPTLSGITVTEDNTVGDPGYVRVGDTVTVTFTSLRVLASAPVVTIAGHAVTAIANPDGNPATNDYQATWDMASLDASGPVHYSISFTDAAGNNGAVADTASALSFDPVAPTVTDVTSTTADGTYPVTGSINVRLTFSESVTVTAGPRVKLETGATDRYATHGSSTTGVTQDFSYVVTAGDESADLNYVDGNSLELNGGTIRDTAGNDAVRTLPAGGSGHTLAEHKALVVDGVIPTVTNVTSTPADGKYKLGQTVTVDVSFSEPVTVTGTANLVLETGATDGIATCAGGSGSVLSFSYVVASDDYSADLDFHGADALSGTIKDGAGNSANLDLTAAGPMSADHGILVDGIAPTVSYVDSTTAAGSYKAGVAINVRVSFAEPVTVTLGSVAPTVTLETGSTDRTADYASAGGNQVSFTYTIVAGDASPDLDYAGTGSFSGGDATIRDAAGNDAVLALPAVGGADSLAGREAIVVDTTPPTVSYVDSTTAAGSYKAGVGINVRVNFGEPVTVTLGSGTPTVTLETGAADRTASYGGGSGTAALSFTYTVVAGDVSPDLDYLDTGSLSPSDATIRDAAGNDAALTLPTVGGADSLAGREAIVIDTAAPTVTNVSSTPADGKYKLGQTVPINVTFSEPVTVTGTASLSLELGATDGSATRVGGSGTVLAFSYVVASDDYTSDLDFTGVSALSGTIRDAAGNDADLDLTAAGSLSADHDILVDGIAPTVTDVSSTTPDGTYPSGSNINVQVTFSEEVTATAAPRVKLETGATDRYATRAAPATSTVQDFSYAVQAGDVNPDLNYVDTASLELNGGTIRDAAGNDAVLTLPAGGSGHTLAEHKALVVDGTVPTVTNVSSTPSNGKYKLGQTVPIDVTFSESVTVTGTASLSLELGATDGSATCVGGSGVVLSFTYVVQSDDYTADLDFKGASALSGTIRDAANNNADLDLTAAGSLSADHDILVDGIAPTVSYVDSATTNDSYKAGSSINVRVNFNEPVIVSTGSVAPTVTLETGTTDRTAGYASASGSQVNLTYTVVAGDGSTDLDYVGTGSFSGGDATIRDAAGNDAVLTLPAVGGADSLAGRAAIVIDTQAPRVSYVSSSTADSTYVLGANINVRVNFDETVVVTTGSVAPTVTLETGTTDHAASYASASGSQVNLTYTVIAGDESPDLDYVGTGSFSGGDATIRDAAGNDAVLTLPATGGADSLAGRAALVIDGIRPYIVSAQSSPGAYPLTVTFNEAVYKVGGGSIDKNCFDYAGGATGVTALGTFSDNDGSDGVLVMGVDDDFIAEDFTTDSIAAVLGALKDVNGNTIGDASVAVTDPPAKSLGARMRTTASAIRQTVSRQVTAIRSLFGAPPAPETKPVVSQAPARAPQPAAVQPRSADPGASMETPSQFLRPVEGTPRADAPGISSEVAAAVPVPASGGTAVPAAQGPQAAGPRASPDPLILASPFAQGLPAANGESASEPRSPLGTGLGLILLAGVALLGALTWGVLAWRQRR